MRGEKICVQPMATLEPVRVCLPKAEVLVPSAIPPKLPGRKRKRLK
jgi:hypothetical protein